MRGVFLWILQSFANFITSENVTENSLRNLAQNGKIYRNSFVEF